MDTLSGLHGRYHRSTAFARRLVFTIPSMEIVYRALFVRDMSTLGISDIFYPVGAAANHSLLYLIVRCFCELNIQNAIDIGAGQSSILISRLCQHLAKPTRIVTVEHDEQWAEYIRPQICHAIYVSKLIPKTARHRKIKHYGGDYFDRDVNYDFILIDGPPAASYDTAMNQLGALEIVENNLADPFVIVIDDAERYGERILIDTIRRYLKKSVMDFGEGTVVAAKRQHIFCSGLFSKAAYF